MSSALVDGHDVIRRIQRPTSKRMTNHNPLEHEADYCLDCGVIRQHIHPSSLPRLLLAAVTGIVMAAAGHVRAEDPAYERPPVSYSTSQANDAGTRLAKAMADGTVALRPGEGKDVLRQVLAALKVPEWSQVLVFSKTSKQTDLISPATPRAVYFSDDVYVGWVPGGLIEIAAADPKLGMVFHTMDPRGARPGPPARDNTCLSCHASARTERVPGVFVRSVYPDANGRPLLRHGGFDTTDRSPLAERWGGWYVTGRHGAARHLGNALARDDDGSLVIDTEANANLDTLAGKIDTTRYLRPDSDIVALLVLEHQCQVHNLIHRCSLDLARMRWMDSQIHPGEDPERADGPYRQMAGRCADELVAAFLCSGEADLGDGVEGSGEFTRNFAMTGPRGRDGHSLRDLRLYRRIFKHRCSPMIYSPSFLQAAPTLRAMTMGKLRDALAADANTGPAAGIPVAERQRTLAILAETIADWPAPSPTR